MKNIKVEKANYIANGKEYLNKAQTFLHDNCDDWDNKKEEVYCRLIEMAKTNLICALALDDLEND